MSTADRRGKQVVCHQSAAMKDLPVSRKCLLQQEAVVVSSGEVWHGHSILLWHVNPAPWVSILLSADLFNYSFVITFSDRNNNSSWPSGCSLR